MVTTLLADSAEFAIQWCSRTAASPTFVNPVTRVSPLSR